MKEWIFDRWFQFSLSLTLSLSYSLSLSLTLQKIEKDKDGERKREREREREKESKKRETFTTSSNLWFVCILFYSSYREESWFKRLEKLSSFLSLSLFLPHFWRWKDERSMRRLKKMRMLSINWSTFWCWQNFFLFHPWTKESDFSLYLFNYLSLPLLRFFSFSSFLLETFLSLLSTSEPEEGERKNCWYNPYWKMFKKRLKSKDRTFW